MITQPEPESHVQPSISDQEYFDRVCSRLRDGTGRAVGSDGSCMYVNNAGHKCAVGIFIPDGHPAQRNNGDVLDLKLLFPDLAGIAWPNTTDGLSLADYLQKTHDSKPSWKGTEFVGEQNLVFIAERYYLKYTPPT